MAEDNCRTILLDDGIRYDLDHLESDELLCDLKDWDYPIFDLLDRYNRSILSAVRKRRLSTSLYILINLPTGLL